MRRVHDQGEAVILGGAALLTVTMLVTKAIGALYKIPLGNLLDEQGMNYFTPPITSITCC